MHFEQQRKINADIQKREEIKANREHVKNLEKEERTKKITQSRREFVKNNTQPIDPEKFKLRGKAVSYKSLFKVMPTKNYSIIRIKTHTTKKGATNAFNHIERLEGHANLNYLNKEAEHPNTNYIKYIEAGKTFDEETGLELLAKPQNPSEIIEKLKEQKRYISYSKNEFTSVEFFMGLSPEVFEQLKDENKKEFSEKFGAVCALFLKERFNVRVCSIRLHQDEQTPHVQAILLPLVPAFTNTKTNEKGKREALTNEAGQRVLTTSKRAMGLGVSAFELVKLHTEFANFLRSRGFEVSRGQVNDPLAKTHKSLKEFKAMTQKTELRKLKAVEKLEAQAEAGSTTKSLIKGIGEGWAAGKNAVLKDAEERAREEVKKQLKQREQEANEAKEKAKKLKQELEQKDFFNQKLLDEKHELKALLNSLPPEAVAAAKAKIAAKAATKAAPEALEPLKHTNPTPTTQNPAKPAFKPL